MLQYLTHTPLPILHAPALYVLALYLTVRRAVLNLIPEET